MPRTPPSVTDLDLLEAVRSRGAVVSYSQLKRWRHRGLLSRNSRRGSGRGRGSTSELLPGAVDAVLAVARHARRGVDLHDAVLRWFLEAGIAKSELWPDGPVPEPPGDAVRAALLWHHDCLFEVPPVLEDDHAADKDAAALRRHITRLGVVPPDGASWLGEYMRTGEFPAGGQRSEQAVRGGLTTIILARIHGVDAVGTDEYIRALSDLRVLPAAYVDNLSSSMIAADLAGHSALVMAPREAERSRISVATHRELVDARHLAQQVLAVVGWLQLVSMTGVSSSNTRQLRAMFQDAALGVFFLGGFVQPLEPASAAPVVELALDPRVRVLFEHVMSEVKSIGFGDVAALMDEGAAQVRQRGSCKSEPNGPLSR